jgi:integrase
MGGFYKNLFQPALEAVGMPARRPAAQLDDGTPMPVLEGVRLHDLRHSFVALQLSAGVHFMQVSQWLGHATYSLTLDVYGDYIPRPTAGRSTRYRSHPPLRSSPSNPAT